MKKHLVVVCGLYYPITSPTAMCAEKYATLFLDEYDIEVISVTQNGMAETVENTNGFLVHTLTCPRVSFEYKSKGMRKKALHSFGSALLFTNYLGNQKWYRKAVCGKLEKIHQSRPIDVVFSVCSPMASHCGCVDFKKRYNEVHLCSYTVDPYSTQDRVKPLLRSRRSMLAFERAILKRMDAVLLSEEVYNKRPELYIGVSYCKSLPYLMPSFKDKSGLKNLFEKNTIDCVYAGSFYKEIRNPGYLLKVFACMPHNIVLHLYSKGCEDIISKYSGISNIRVHGMVSPIELEKVYDSADILIGVGNAIRDFLPSKTFEYIAQLKPIVYFNYEGIDNEVMNVYPAALQLSNSEAIDLAVNELKIFCQNCFENPIRQDSMLESYKKYSSENIKKIITDAFNNNK